MSFQCVPCKVRLYCVDSRENRRRYVCRQCGLVVRTVESIVEISHPTTPAKLEKKNEQD